MVNGKFFLILFSVCCSLLLLVFFTVFKDAAIKSYDKNETDVRTFFIDEKDANALLMDDTRLDNGHILFKSICYKCHVISEDNSMVSGSDYQFLMQKGTMIFHGNRKGMPAYKQRLQASDIEDLAGFLTKIRANYKIKLSR